MTYLLTHIALMLGEFEGHFFVWNFVIPRTWGNIARDNYEMNISCKVYVACNFNCIVKTEGLLNITNSYMLYTTEVVLSRKWCKIENVVSQYYSMSG